MFTPVSEDVIFIDLLHALLPPSIRHSAQNSREDTSQNKKRRICKSTIKDSQQTLLLKINSPNDFYPEIDKLAAKLRERGQTLQPLIVFDTANSDFIVYYDDIKYKFNHFLPALDTCFKIFFVFNLEYPECCKSVWLFIQQFFFEIASETTVRPCSNVLILMQSLRTQISQ